jgi:hypothetical protein
MDQGSRIILCDHSYGSIPETAPIKDQTIEKREGRGLEGAFCALVRVASGPVQEMGLHMHAKDELLPLGTHTVIHEELSLSSTVIASTHASHPNFRH